MIPLRMTVHYVMFAAHADHDQTKRFITALKPPNVILVHGERKAMGRVKLSLNDPLEIISESVTLQIVKVSRLSLGKIKYAKLWAVWWMK